ncbi:AAA family ATPase [Mesorhizobium caraganae]|uniref:AAA family ATPase n=1 Tax=Mesorhizobium caraganae TaxID=483206 RepID=UPI0033390D73
MQREALEKTIIDLGVHATKSGQVLGPQQLFIHCIDQRRTRQPAPALDAARDAITTHLLRFVDKKDPQNQETVATFEPETAVASCLAFLADKPLLSDHDCLLWWLLDDDFDDRFGWFKACRRLCLANRLTPSIFVGADGVPVVSAELGFGHFIEQGGAPAEALVGRELDIERHLSLLRMALLRDRHYLITGEHGVGKTVFLMALLQRALSRFSAEADGRLSQRRFLLIRAVDLMSDGARIERRMQTLFDLLRRDPSIVVAFDDVNTCLEPALPGSTAFRDAIGYYLMQPQRSFVLVSSVVAARKHDMLRNLQTHPLPALDVDSTALLTTRHLEALRREMSTPLAFDPSAEALAAEIVATAREHYSGRYFPEVALHLAAGTVERAEGRVTYFRRAPVDRITLDDLRMLVSEELGIAPEILGKDPEAFYAELGNKLAAKVIGQDHAVQLVTKVLAVERRVGSASVPRGRFLFLGPPGVGKTYLARSLAQGLGYDQDSFFALNMGEYSTDGSRTRFIGADPGYIGYNTSHTIYEVVRSRPSSVILLDEIDRAHPTIQDILLSVLEGRGNNASGEEVQFSQTIFILTTNLGQEQVEAAYRDMRGQESSRPEIASKLDDEQLRNLILAGAVDQFELDMMRQIDLEIDAIRGTPGGGEVLLERYLTLKDRRRALELVRRHAGLDRAFLDRIDFVVPFFPIDDPADLARVVRLKLEAMGWSDCPAPVQHAIVTEVAAGGSIRMIDRLIKKWRLDA